MTEIEQQTYNKAIECFSSGIVVSQNRARPDKVAVITAVKNYVIANPAKAKFMLDYLRYRYGAYRGQTQFTFRDVDWTDAYYTELNNFRLSAVIA